MLAVASCISDLGIDVNNIECIGARAQFQLSESAQSTSLNVKDEEVATELKIEEKIARRTPERIE